MKTNGYSLENAHSFGWASLTGKLNPARVACLQKYLVGHKILDAGCGGGGYVKFLSDQGLESVGVDKYEDFLQVARSNDPTGTYFQGDLTDLPFDDKSFDCTFCFDVLEHVDDNSAIKELARVTKKRLIIAVPREDKNLDEHGLTLRHYIDHTHLRYYTEKILGELAASVSPRQFSIHPELPVEFAPLFNQLSYFRLPQDAPAFVKLILQFYASKNFLAQVIRRKPISASVARKRAYQQFEIFLKNKFISQISFKEIYTGLVAVIDLD